MRRNEFFADIRDKFPEILTDEIFGLTVATAISIAEDKGHAWFMCDNVRYKIEAVWVDHCINYNCNPATCYTDWTICVD